MNQRLTRRDFLKLASVLPLLQLKLPVFHSQPARAPEASGRPNILILVFDALSAEHMSLYGYSRETTPNLARFAERATVFHSNYSAGNFTSAGTGSLLTGTHPWSHRAFHLHSTVDDSFKDRNLFSLFAKSGYFQVAYSHNLLVTSLLYQFHEHIDSLLRTRELCLVDDQLADRLFPNDFSAAFWSEWLALRGGKTPPGSLLLSLMHRVLRHTHKLEANREYRELFPKGVPTLHNLYFILEDAIDWIELQLTNMTQPFLAYVHLLPPHEPYTTRADFVDRFKDGWAPQAKPSPFFSQGHQDHKVVRNRQEYDEYLAYADSEFGRLLDFMLDNNVLDNTCVIFTSDHGEMFERGIIGHVTQTLYQPVIQVPLMVASPGQGARLDVHTPTSSVDLLPTLLHLAGQPIPDWVEGSILPTFSQDPSAAERAVYALEAKANPKYAPLVKGTATVIENDLKLTHYFGYQEHRTDFELYDLAVDPEEQHDVYPVEGTSARHLRQRLEDKLAEVNRPYQRPQS